MKKVCRQLVEKLVLIINHQVRPPAPCDPGGTAQAVQRPRRVRGAGHLQAVQGCAGLDQDLPYQRAHAQPEAHQSRYRSSG